MNRPMASGPYASPRRGPGTTDPNGPISMSPTRVIVMPVAAPMAHPLTKRDVQRVLSVLPAESTAGLRSVSLLGELWTSGGYPVLVTYRRNGFIRLHAVPTEPWRIGPLESSQVADLLRYGARVDAGQRGCIVTWRPEALRLFYTVGVLLPGVARHRREMEGAGEPGSVVRSLEHANGPWQVSDLALDHWRRFLADGDRAREATA